MKKETIKEGIVWGIILQAFLGVAGSLYMSSYGDPVANVLSGDLFPIGAALTPCELCWFARILLYPILPIALIGYIKSDRNFVDYVIPLSIGGALLTGYQYSTQKFGVQLVAQCTSTVACDQIQLEYWGFITIPFLAFISFCLITALSLWYRRIN